MIDFLSQRAINADSPQIGANWGLAQCFVVEMSSQRFVTEGTCLLVRLFRLLVDFLAWRTHGRLDDWTTVSLWPAGHTVRYRTVCWADFFFFLWLVILQRTSLVLLGISAVSDKYVGCWGKTCKREGEGSCYLNFRGSLPLQKICVVSYPVVVSKLRIRNADLDLDWAVSLVSCFEDLVRFEFCFDLTRLLSFFAWTKGYSQLDAEQKSRSGSDSFRELFVTCSASVSANANIEPRAHTHKCQWGRIYNASFYVWCNFFDRKYEVREIMHCTGMCICSAMCNIFHFVPGLIRFFCLLSFTVLCRNVRDSCPNFVPGQIFSQTLQMMWFFLFLQGQIIRI